MHPIPFLCIFILSCMADNTKTVDGLPHHNSSAQLNNLQDKPEPTTRSRLDLVWILHKLPKSQNNIINQHQPPGDDEQQAKSRRETENAKLDASRARKAGCRVFFWKSFTAC